MVGEGDGGFGGDFVFAGEHSTIHFGGEGAGGMLILWFVVWWVKFGSSLLDMSAVNTKGRRRETMLKHLSLRFKGFDFINTLHICDFFLSSLLHA